MPDVAHRSPKIRGICARHPPGRQPQPTLGRADERASSGRPGQALANAALVLDVWEQPPHSLTRSRRVALDRCESPGVGILPGLSGCWAKVVRDVGARRERCGVGPMAVRKRSKYSLIAASCVLLAAGLTVGLITVSSGSRSPARGRASAAVFSSAQLVRLERGLTAPTVDSQAAVVAPQIRTQFLDRGQPLLPAGSRVRISSATFRFARAGLATVNAVITGPEAGRWQLILIRNQGHWLIIGTRRLS